MADAQPLPLLVLYEDDHLLAVAKDAGVVAHPCYKHPDGTLFNGLLWHLRGTGVHPHLLQRLDKDTSGVMLVSKTMRGHAAMVRAMQRQGPAGVRKEYLAVVHGVPEPGAGEISLRLRRDAVDSRRVAASETDGKESRTGYRTLASCGDRPCSALLCELFTGRMHQLRVHLAARGWPLIGDAVYGLESSEDLVIGRQALHAWRVSFRHPLSGESVSVKAPIPPDLGRLLEQYGLPIDVLQKRAFEV